MTFESPLLRTVVENQDQPVNVQLKAVFDLLLDSASKMMEPAYDGVNCLYEKDGSFENGCVIGRQLHKDDFPEYFSDQHGDDQLEGQRASDIVFNKIDKSSLKNIQLKQMLCDIQQVHDKLACAEIWTNKSMIAGMNKVATEYKVRSNEI